MPPCICIGFLFFSHMRKTHNSWANYATHGETNTFAYLGKKHLALHLSSLTSQVCPTTPVTFTIYTHVHTPVAKTTSEEVTICTVMPLSSGSVCCKSTMQRTRCKGRGIEVIRRCFDVCSIYSDISAQIIFLKK